MLKLNTEHMAALYYSFDGKMVIEPKKYDDPYDNWYYQNLCLPSDMIEHMELLEDMAYNCAVLELGTRYGVSTSAFAHSAHRVWTVDIVDCSQYIPKECTNVTHIVGDSTSIDYDSFVRYPDIVLIDTEHTFEQVVKEFEHIVSLNPAFVLFHDYQIPEVKAAIDYIAKTHGYIYEINGEVFPLVIMKVDEL
jgi:cephalosporin hydroxylase